MRLRQRRCGRNGRGRCGHIASGCLRFGVLEPPAESDIAELEADGMAADLHSFGAVELVSRRRTRGAIAPMQRWMRSMR